MRPTSNAHVRATTEQCKYGICTHGESREQRARAESTLLVHQTKPWTRLSSNVTLVFVSPGRFIKAPSIMST
jgi:hypothetical protein